MRTRSMSEKDARAVAWLSTELGYPASEEEVRQRFRALDGAKDQELLVAQDDDGGVVGWVHTHVLRLLQTDPVAEVWALVVDESCRGSGVGRLLVTKAERWAKKKGCGEVRLRSNVIRKDAHRFYEGIGYGIHATSLVFYKTLDGHSSGSP